MQKPLNPCIQLIHSINNNTCSICNHLFLNIHSIFNYFSTYTCHKHKHPSKLSYYIHHIPTFGHPAFHPSRMNFIIKTFPSFFILVLGIFVISICPILLLRLLSWSGISKQILKTRQSPQINACTSCLSLSLVQDDPHGMCPSASLLLELESIHLPSYLVFVQLVHMVRNS